jgi:hypothetical protein
MPAVADVKPKKSRKELELEITQEIFKYAADPLGYVKFAYPWGSGPLEKFQGPYAWQKDILDRIGKHLRGSETWKEPLRIAVASGKGVGKSSLVSMIINWAMSTCDDCKIVLTANTDTQLATKTWPEVEKWSRMMVNSHWFDVNATSISAKSSWAPGHDRTWRTDRIPWNENNCEAFAGLHNKGKRIVVIFDEASAISDRIWEVVEGALTDSDTEIMWIAFGNPTKNTGRFRECFGSRQHRWNTLQLDSRTVEGTNKKQIAEWEEDYGVDDDWFKVNVRGEFPSRGFNQFISSETVAYCRKYKAMGYTIFPKILGVDVARFGDDKTVIMMRQGRKFTLLGRYSGLDTAQVTAHVIHFMNEHQVDATVVDSDGIGNTVFDQLKFSGFSRRLYEFHGGKPANNPLKYFNQRSEVWGKLKDMLEAGAEIPDLPELEQDLTGPEYTFSAQAQIKLEKKDEMKARGMNSPDMGDSMAMSCAVDIAMPKQPEPKKFMQASYRQSSQQWMA